MTETAHPTIWRGMGYAHAPEWAAHRATWLAWPHNAEDWPGKFAPVPWVFVEMIRALAGGERIRLVVNSAEDEVQARAMLQKAGVDLGRVDFVPLATDRGWLRDAGPIFVCRTGDAPLAVVDFQFNGWAKYDDWQHDNQIARLAAAYLQVPVYRAEAGGRPLVLEGGSIDVNGAGTVITTEACLLDRDTQPRNPHLSRGQIEAALSETLGVDQVIWLGQGIAGDDTHGHVDDLCRFVNEKTVVLCRARHAQDENYRALEENHERLQGVWLANGEALETIDLPMPEPLYFAGQRLPASYANFYIGNQAVLVPTFNDPNDREALGILGEVFPDRTVRGIHAVDLIWGLGAVHCLTHEEPRPD